MKKADDFFLTEEPMMIKFPFFWIDVEVYVMLWRKSLD